MAKRKCDIRGNGPGKNIRIHRRHKGPVAMWKEELSDGFRIIVRDTVDTDTGQKPFHNLHHNSVFRARRKDRKIREATKNACAFQFTVE